MPAEAKSNSNSATCARSSSRTPSSRTTHTRSRSSFLLAAALLLLATSSAAAELASAPSRDRKVARRWSLSGKPHGLAIGCDGTIYAGLAGPQAVVAIDADNGKIISEVVLDSEEIASTKEFVAMRLSPDCRRLAISQGSDESVTILSLPSMKIEREILLEGEAVRDAQFSPDGKFLVIAARSLYVFDAEGANEQKVLSDEPPMAITFDRAGGTLAVAMSEQFDSGAATVIVFYEVDTLREIAREPLQTEKKIESLHFAASDRAIVAVANDWVGEKSLAAAKTPVLTRSGESTRMRFDFGDFVSSERICLPDAHGSQHASVSNDGSTLYFAEKRCSQGGSFTGSKRLVRTASVYPVDAYSVAFDAEKKLLYATDPAGYLTAYKLPQAESPK